MSGDAEYLILSPRGVPLPVLLGDPGAIPPAAIVARAPDRIRAGFIALDLLRGKPNPAVVPGVAQGIGRHPEVVVRGPRETYHYHQDYQDSESRTGRYRVLCHNYGRPGGCANPLAPWAFYRAPSRADRRGICEHCRRRDPSPAVREGMAAMNRDRARKRREGAQGTGGREETGGTDG